VDQLLHRRFVFVFDPLRLKAGALFPDQLQSRDSSFSFTRQQVAPFLQKRSCPEGLMGCLANDRKRYGISALRMPGLAQNVKAQKLDVHRDRKAVAAEELSAGGLLEHFTIVATPRRVYIR
jgi:hypothetical protein